MYRNVLRMHMTLNSTDSNTSPLTQLEKQTDSSYRGCERFGVQCVLNVRILL